MGSQAIFLGFDHVIAHFTHRTQKNDPQKEHLVIKVRISVSYPNSRALNQRNKFQSDILSS